MAKSQNPTLQYRFITWALFPLALIYTLYIAFKYKNLTYLLQRFGVYSQPNHSDTHIWCHCASVGEINTALPLLRSLTSQGKNLVVTTNTVTGYDTLADAKLQRTNLVFLPLDYKYFTNRLINHVRPNIVFIFETELWPNLLLNIASKQIPIAILNGRISNKTLKAPSFMLKNYEYILNNICKIFSSSDDNTARFISLGADPDIISTLDNLKFSNLGLKETIQTSKPLNYDYLLCASTHENEEQEILNAWKKRPINKLSLVIALRHPKRIKQVVKVLENLNLSYHRHSDNSSKPTSDSIYIIDTLGELIPFLAHAKIVFMAGSLMPIGGHNMIEPARYKRCIITGKHYDNFKGIVDDLKANHAIEIIDTADEMIALSQSLHEDDIKRIQMGERAFRYIESKNHILDKYNSKLFQLMSDHDI